MFSKIKNWYNNLPEQKKKLEFITALLTIPVLLTVIASNILNIKIKQQESKPHDNDQKPTTIVITQAPQPTTPANGVTIIPVEVTKEVQPTSGPECIKDIGPIEIVSPSQNQIVSDDPVCIDINYEQGNFCSVVWSYRINQTAWSDFTNKGVCFSNLLEGETKFELRVKSVVSDKEKLLERNFVVKKEKVSPAPSETLPTPSETPPVSP